VASRRIVSPNVALGGLAAITVFRNPHVAVQSVAASPVPGGFAVRGGAGSLSTMETFTIARVGLPDLDGLLPLMRAYCDFYSVSPTDEDLLGMSRALIADRECEGVQFIARAADGAAVGFASLFWTWDTTEGGRIAVMNDLYVNGDARGGGVGTSLIEACRAEARGRGACVVAWQTALDNTHAQSVYDRIGAERAQWLGYSLPVE